MVGVCHGQWVHLKACRLGKRCRGLVEVSAGSWTYVLGNPIGVRGAPKVEDGAG